MPFWLEVTLCAVYVLLGPLTWGFMILSMFEGRRRMSALFRRMPELPEPAPRVTIMIPARNEEANIEACVGGALSQDYPNLAVVVANDRSSDRTGEILGRLAAADARLRVVHLSDADFMTGWGGKSSTLHNAYEKGVKAIANCGLPIADSSIDNPQSAIRNSSEFLFGLDADVRLTSPAAISNCVRGAIKHDAAIFSLLPALESQSFFEELVIPLTGMLSSAINAVALTNVDSFKKVAYANGQCLLIRREVYDAVGGHTKVGKIVAEDVALAYLVKGTGRRVRVAWGADLCTIRMYDSLSAVYKGLSRIISVSRERRVWPMLAGIAFLTLCMFSMVPAAAMSAWRFAHPVSSIGGWGWLAAVVAHLVTMVIVLGLTYAWSKNRWWMALLWPIGGAIALAIFVRALRQAITGRIEWRGMTYEVRRAGA
jgi:chlorobactene glucosyltransferase